MSEHSNLPVVERDAEAEATVAALSGRPFVIVYGIDLPPGSYEVAEEGWEWFHHPAPSCPRSPCYGREDDCPNGEWLDTYALRPLGSGDNQADPDS